MKAPAARLFTWYACLLKLYPPRYQGEFGEERREVFAQALEDALDRGHRALFRLVFLELHDLPVSVIKANLREWRDRMKTDERLSWLGLLFGAWPFLFVGLLMAVSPYLPQPAARLINFLSPLWLAAAGLSILVGLVVGWRNDFPRWTYPYLVVPFFALVIPFLGWLGPLLPGGSNPWMSMAFILCAFLGFGAAALYVLSRIPATRKIYADIREDWTRLSFGMFVWIAFWAGFYGGDHLPPFSLAVWLPSAIVLLGAVAYLLCRSRWMRAVVLVVTLAITLLNRLTLSGTEAWAIWPAVLLALLVLSPALVGLLPHHQVLQAGSHA